MPGAAVVVDFDVQTVEEALEMLREAVELYLEDQPLSAPPPHPVVTPFEITVPAA